MRYDTNEIANIQRQIAVAVKRLEQFGAAMAEDNTKILEYAAIPLVDELQRRAPVGTRVHYRYSTAKADRGMRAPKGMGSKIATYKPGNLKRAFRTLKFRRSKDLFVGVKLAKGTKGGVFGDSKFDGYYLHWLEFGRKGMSAKPIVRPSVATAGKTVLKRLENGYTVRARRAAAQITV